ncbi:MAG: hypothetical protein HY735_26855 [Verrucomicrobia bacterium]|nr:hypothetical protein [Verrucomicrobiota bacterium]
MNAPLTRRNFLHRTASTTALFGLGDFAFLSRLPRLSAADAKLDPKIVRFDGEIEPLVRFLEDTPRERLLEEIATRIRGGLSYREVLAAVLLAGIRNIQPRPVGFKFHAVMVVNSAHLASLSSPDSDRWLPIFWAVDNFKSSQAQDYRDGDWTMPAVDESAIPPSHKARLMVAESMKNWDEAEADSAATALARSAGAQEIFELFARYGQRDFRNIGHKAIYVANGWRTLQAIGWQHAEPVLRSLAFALLARDRNEDNPAKNDYASDRPWRRNTRLVSQIRADWQAGKVDPSAATEMLITLRQGSDEDAAKKAVELLNRGTAPQSLWDAMFDAAGELLMRQPGIATLHSVTATNALHFAYQNSGQDETRRLLLLQNASFIPLFRSRLNNQAKDYQIDRFEPLPLKSDPAHAADEIFADASQDRLTAARKALSYLKENANPKPLIDAARRLVFLKGTDSHDYKFSSAVLEDYRHVSPAWRDRYLASSLFYLRGSGAADNKLVTRIREALKG